MSERARFLALVRSFHVLRGAAGVSDEGVDLSLLDRWASDDPDVDRSKLGNPFPGDASKCAARFVLNLWHSRERWRVGPFDVFEAMRVWDDRNLAAFQAWAANPWRP